ncbi:MAG: Ig-like domain-containing protein [Terracidiphilus sp.]
MKTFNSIPLFILAFAMPAFATVAVSSPSNGATVSSTVSFAATATTTTCSKGVASMGVYVDYELLFTVNGTILNTTLSVNPGKHNTVVEEWDYCGGATFVSMEITVTTQAGIHVTSPANNSAVSSPVNYVATATSSCTNGVASMGIYVNGQLTYVEDGASLNAQLSLGPGSQQTVVEEWDRCGGASYTPINITVQDGENVLSNLQASGGWSDWGELPPNYDICSAPCSGVTWAMSQHASSPSLSGNSTRFEIGGTTPYADILWSIPVLGQNTTQGIPDTAHRLLPTLHNFTYDAYFYVTNASITQVLEFDINMYMDGAGMIWGNQCNHLGGGTWDIWDNVNANWVSTGFACDFLDNAWNHVTIQVQRESGNEILYQSITMNGKTAIINKTYPPFSVPNDWWGVTLNYQMDGNYKQSSNTTYVDNLSFTYW